MANDTTGLGVQIEADGADISSWRLDVAGEDLKIKVHPGAIVQCHIYMRGTGHRLVIGAGSILHNSVAIVFEDNNCTTEIGERARIHPMTNIANLEGRTLRIGADCLLSAYVTIRTSDSHSVLDAANGTRINQAADIQINDRVWIGERAAILKGVSVGSDSVIGISSIVTSDVPEGTVVAGYPARVVRSGVKWSHSRV